MDIIKILIADDHEVIHSGISEILKREKNLVIIDHAYDGAEAIEKSVSLNPDIVFMDISMPLKNGIEATRSIVEKLPDIRIIALTQHEETEYVKQFLKSGGHGYLLKNSKHQDFKNAIETVLKGKKYLSYDLSVAIAQETLEVEEKGHNKQKVHLTRREIEIIKKIAEDKNNNEIAAELHISLRTVETHRRNIARKLNAKSVVSVIKYAIQNNLINL